MCGCFLPLIGVYLLTTGSSNATRMLGAILIGLSLVGTWANRLTGRQRIQFGTFPSAGGVFTGQPRSPAGMGRGMGGFGMPTASLSRDGEAFFTILGMIAKADGHVSNSEINALEPLLPNDSPAVRQEAIDAFQRGRDQPELLETMVASLFSEVRPQQVDGLFDLFCRVALVDGQIASGERDVLQRIERLLYGTTSRTDRFLGAGQQAWSGGTGGRSGPSQASAPKPEEDPHVIFGLPNPTTKEAIKKRYRELVKTHHPDRVRGSGVPEEAVKAAEQQMRRINVARDALRRQYG